MAVNTQASGFLQAVRAWNLKLGIGTDEGVDAFSRVLASGLTQVMAVTMDMRPMLAREKLHRREVKVEEEALSSTSTPAQEEAAGAGVAVGGDIERLIARAWAKVLGRGDIGADDNFFELGGDSLTALQAIAVLKGLLGREVPIVTFYEAPTVALLAKALAPKPEEEKADRVDGLEESGKRADTRRELLERRRRQRGGALAARSVVEES
jgi:acyl carrier protein